MKPFSATFVDPDALGRYFITVLRHGVPMNPFPETGSALGMSLGQSRAGQNQTILVNGMLMGDNQHNARM